MALPLNLNAKNLLIAHLHRIGPLFVRVFDVCPLPMQFFSVDRVHIFAWMESALAFSPKNGEVFRIGRDPPSLTYLLEE